MSKLIILTTFLMLFAFSNITHAANHYIRPNGSVYGVGDGSDWNNAYDGFPEILVRGDTYYVAGGDYTNGVTFDDAESGLTYIYIKKANASDNSGVAGWASSFATLQAVFSNASDTTYGAAWIIKGGYYDFDGVTGADQSGYGIKLTYGSTGHRHNLILLRDNNCAGLRIQHIEFETPGPTDDNSQLPIKKVSGNFEGMYIANNYAYNFQQFTKIDSSGAPWIIEHNYLKDQWSSSANHGELLAIVGSDGLIFRYNICENTCYGTGGIIILGKGSMYGDVENVEVYGNVFFGGGGIGNGLFAVGNSADPCGIINCKFYNNTIVNNQAKFFTGNPGVRRSSGNEIKNNLFYGSNAGIIADSDEYTAENNYYNSCTDVPSSMVGIVLSSESTSLLFEDYESNNFDLRETAAVVDTGANLDSSYSSIDIEGRLRTEGNSMDIGAYEYLFLLSAPSNARISEQ